jgi:SAM-dependent methyltransferase
MADAWYAHARADHFWIQWRFQAMRRLLRNVELGNRVLDVGCGSGIVRDQLEACYDRPVLGCDLNVAALERAKPGRGKLYLYDVHDRRPEWAGAFDSVFLLDTLEHIDDAVGFLQSIRFHVADHGLLVINVPALQSMYSVYDEVAGHVKRYSLAVLREELGSAGFAIARYAHWGLLMLPVLAARKWMLRFCDRDRVITRGFEPPTKWTDCLLRTLMAIERRCIPRPWIGSSLLVAARKTAETLATAHSRAA